MSDIKNLDKLPDPKKHLYISIAKSVLRILASILIIVAAYFNLFWILPLMLAGVLFGLAEVLGIVEELV